jgi:hypothetical protein
VENVNYESSGYLSADWFYRELSLGRDRRDVMVEIVANIVSDEAATCLAESYRKRGFIISEVRRFKANRNVSKS